VKYNEGVISYNDLKLTYTASGRYDKASRHRDVFPFVVRLTELITNRLMHGCGTALAEPAFSMYLLLMMHYGNSMKFDDSNNINVMQDQ